MASFQQIDCGPGSPLVVILGWLNAKDQYVRKYAEKLEALGYSSLRFTCPAADVMSIFERPQIAWAKQLLRRIQEEHLSPPRKLLLYTFSNGGTMIYHQIIKLMQADPRFRDAQRSFCGSIFDSAPSYMHLFTGADAFTAGTRGPQAWAIKLAFYLTVLLGLLFMPLIGNFPAKYWNTCREMRNGHPELYLYSMDDPLCDAEKLGSLIEYRQQKGNDVRQRSWQKSGHVAHLRNHPSEYVQELENFLKLCTGARK